MPAGQPERVNVYDFLDQEPGKVTPYGVYDVTANTGWVNVGTDTTPPRLRWPPSAPGGTPGRAATPAPPGC